MGPDIRRGFHPLLLPAVALAALYLGEQKPPQKPKETSTANLSQSNTPALPQFPSGAITGNPDGKFVPESFKPKYSPAPNDPNANIKEDITRQISLDNRSSFVLATFKHPNEKNIYLAVISRNERPEVVIYDTSSLKLLPSEGRVSAYFRGPDQARKFARKIDGEAFSIKQHNGGTFNLFDANGELDSNDMYQLMTDGKPFFSEYNVGHLHLPQGVTELKKLGVEILVGNADDKSLLYLKVPGHPAKSCPLTADTAELSVLQTTDGLVATTYDFRNEGNYFRTTDKLVIPFDTRKPASHIKFNVLDPLFEGINNSKPVKVKGENTNNFFTTLSEEDLQNLFNIISVETTKSGNLVVTVADGAFIARNNQYLTITEDPNSGEILLVVSTNKGAQNPNGIQYGDSMIYRLAIGDNTLSGAVEEVTP